MYYSLRNLLVTLIYLFLLSACGGGGDGGGDNDTDTTAPIITVTGDNTATVEQNTTYTDAGATASDAVDGTVSVTSSGTVDTSVVGSYTITYTSTDVAGNTATLLRIVNVIVIIPPDTTEPVIILIGDNPVTVEQNTTYTDAGATASDAVDGTVSVISSGTVDTSVVGSYTITYTSTDVAGNTATLLRIVNVIVIIPPDTTEPVITLIGDNPATVEQNTTYTDAGATASDAVDGTVSVTSSGTADTSVVGSSVITYTATDAAGNTATLTRTVNIVILGPAIVINKGGSLGATLTPGLVDIDGDGTSDINFVSFGVDSGFLDANAPYGLVGNIGGGPGSGAAWVQSTSVLQTIDGVGRNEIIVSSRGAIMNSDDNWSKVHLSSGEGWVQWEFGATRDIVKPLVFVREGENQNLQASEAASLAYPARIVASVGAIGVTLTPGLVDIDGDGTSDINFVSTGGGNGFLDANAPYGLVGNIGGEPGSGAAWVQGTSVLEATDGVGRNEIIASFRGAIMNSDDNWSKVHFSSGEGWVQWEFGATGDIVKPLVFVREGRQDLNAAEAASIAYPSLAIRSGGSIGTMLTTGLVDVDGDGISDIDFVSSGVGSGFLDANAPYGLVGNIGGGPGSGAAWVQSTSVLQAIDGVGRNEIIASFRGAIMNSDDNWSKVHLSSGSGWVQWEFGATRDIVKPLVFVREGINLELNASQAASFAYAPVVIVSGGAIGTTLSTGLVDIDGDGISDIDFVSFGVGSGFLDANAPYGLVGNIGGEPGSGAAWVQSTSVLQATDGVGRNEIIASSRGAIMNSDDNWSKVHLSSGEGWVQWEFGATRDIVKPLVFVREGLQDLNAAEAEFLTFEPEVITTGGALGTTLTTGLVDIDGDAISDINFVSFGEDSGFLDANAPYGLVGNIGGEPGSGAAWVQSTSVLQATDGVGRNEIIASFRGAIMNSDDNWSKVHFSSGAGWVQWEFGATRDIVKPLVFVREGERQNFQVIHAKELAYPWAQYRWFE
jgi:hypothetical protein